jgi:hypothetical protein
VSILPPDNPWIGRAVIFVAAILALVSARPYAGSWNDGSRLATVECLVDHHTFAIDESIFVQPSDPSPYVPGDELLRTRGTQDKLLINGHWYSDKSPVPALLLAGIYQVSHWTTGLSARENPGRFCWIMTLACSGLAYVVAVGCVWGMTGLLRLLLAPRILLTSSFALATVALPYAEFVNNHVLLLGVSAVLVISLLHIAEVRDQGHTPWGWLAGVGTLAGFGYSIDLGAGPVLLLCTGVLVMARCRRVGPVLLFAVAALPWLVLHHAVNYHVGGTIRPANAVAEYLAWPDSPFTGKYATGGWKHESWLDFAIYAAALLGGKQGSLGYNPVLFLILPALLVLLRRSRELPEILFALALCSGTWLLYAANSRNYSGPCLSVRWFVPLLVPGFYLLAVLVKRRPDALADVLILSAGGLVIAGLGWWGGPWSKVSGVFFWPIQGITLAAWGVYRLRRYFRLDSRKEMQPDSAEGVVQKRAA